MVCQTEVLGMAELKQPETADEQEQGDVREPEVCADPADGTAHQAVQALARAGAQASG